MGLGNIVFSYLLNNFKFLNNFSKSFERQMEYDACVIVLERSNNEFEKLSLITLLGLLEHIQDIEKNCAKL